MSADALATALTSMGSEKARELAQKQGLAVFFIARDQEGGFIEDETSAFKKLLEQKKGPN